MIDLWVLLAICALITYLWRGPGVLISNRLDPGSAAFTGISCVAYAMIAGLIARVLVMPSGALALWLIKS